MTMTPLRVLFVISISTAYNPTTRTLRDDGAPTRPVLGNSSRDRDQNSFREDRDQNYFRRR